MTFAHRSCRILIIDIFTCNFVFEVLSNFLLYAGTEHKFTVLKIYICEIKGTFLFSSVNLHLGAGFCKKEALGCANTNCGMRSVLDEVCFVRSGFVLNHYRFERLKMDYFIDICSNIY